MQKEKPIGLFDSGVGGLTIAHEVIKALPGENIIYYGDNLHLPYGNKPREKVREYALRIIDFFVKDMSVKYVIIACNTATVAIYDDVFKFFSIPIIGPVEEGAKKAVKLSTTQNIGLLATVGTVESGGYQNAIKKINPGARIIAVKTPLLVPLIEKGIIEGPEMEKVLKKYLNPILSAHCDCLILGCTHYSFLAELIEKLSDGKLRVIFPGEEIARKVKDYLKDNNQLNPSEKGYQIFLTSKLSHISKEFLQVINGRLGLSLNFEEKNIFI